MDAAEIIKQSAVRITADDIICLAGLISLGVWLLRTSWGTRALADSAPRRNSMPAYLPFIVLFLWVLVVSIAAEVTKELLADSADWQGALVDNLVFCIGGLVGIAAVIILAGRCFARRLKGFGLNIRTIGKDFLAAIVNLFTVWPLVALMLAATIFFGQLIWGPDFELQQHSQLKMAAEYSQLAVRVLIVAAAVVIVPAFEEMLFRGLFQTMIRSYLERPWPAVFIVSALFATVHANAGHWPALFALSVCMGYAYEKSGSLFRPIFIHLLFNATSVIFVMQGS